MRKYDKRKVPRRLSGGRQLYYCRYKRHPKAVEEGCGRVVNVDTLPGMEKEYVIGDSVHGYLCRECGAKRKEVREEARETLRQRWASSPFRSILYWRDRNPSHPPPSYFRPGEGLLVLQQALKMDLPKWDAAVLRNFPSEKERVRHVANQVRNAQVRIYPKYARHILRYLAPPEFGWGADPMPPPPSKELCLWFLLHPGAPELFPVSTLWAMCRSLLRRIETYTQWFPALRVDLLDIYDEYLAREAEAWDIEQRIIQYDVSCATQRVRPEYARKTNTAARWQRTLPATTDELARAFRGDVVTGLGREVHAAVIHLCEMLHRWSRVALPETPAWEFREQIFEEIASIFHQVLCSWQAKAFGSRENAAFVAEQLMNGDVYYLDPRAQPVHHKIAKLCDTWPVFIRRADSIDDFSWRDMFRNVFRIESALYANTVLPDIYNAAIEPVDRPVSIRTLGDILKKRVFATCDYPIFKITRLQMFGKKEGGWKNAPADKQRVAMLCTLKGFPSKEYRLDIEFAQKLVTRTPVVYELRQPHVDADNWGPVRMAFHGFPAMTTLYLRHSSLKSPKQRCALLTLIAQHPLISGRARLALAHWLDDPRLWQLMGPWILMAYLGSYAAQDLTMMPLINAYPAMGPAKYAQLIRDYFPDAMTESSLTGGFYAAAYATATGTKEQMMRAISWMRTDNRSFGSERDILEYAGWACRWAALQLCHCVLDLGACLYPDLWPSAADPR